MLVVIFAGGDLRDGKLVQKAIKKADFIIAADSGAVNALMYGCVPEFVVGDFDSLDNHIMQQLQKEHCQIITSPREKDETDTELAVSLAIEKGATSITILGALGADRFDHTVGNILLLASITKRSDIIDGASKGWILREGEKSIIIGHKGDLLSLLPLTQNAKGIRTQGLYYPLHGETLYFGKPRGISNVLTEKRATVSLEKGMLLIIHTDVEELK